MKQNKSLSKMKPKAHSSNSQGKQEKRSQVKLLKPLKSGGANALADKEDKGLV